MRSTTCSLYLALLFLVVFLPAGSMWGLNVKVISLEAFLAAFALYLITDGNVLSSGDIIFLCLVGACLCFWSLVGILRGYADGSQTLSQFRDFASAIFIAWLGITFIRRRLIRAELLTTMIVYALFAMACMKWVAIAAMYIYGTNPIGAIQSVFGQDSLVYGEFASGMLRMHFPADMLAPFGLFALLTPGVSGVRFGRTSRFFISIFLLTSCILAYSRYVWFAFVIAALVAAAVQRSWKMLAVMILGGLLLGALLGDVSRVIFEERFASVGLDISDEGRVDQSKALIAEIKERPILGKGMGTQALGHISSEAHPYSYELQWLSFLMQFGIVGELGILLLVVTSARDLIAANHPAKPWIILLFLLWLLASWTNPYLISSYAGATFVLFMAFFYRLRNDIPTREPPSCAFMPDLQV
jgi:O-antigen ligase